ncbi:MAG TPA: RIP metalloprotease RseP [Pseudomonadales bacterium]
MEFLQYPLALIVMLGVLITFHELGHFLVARRSGVRVLRFSVGFGKPLWSRVDRHGTEWAIAAIPLGGYVRMLGEQEPGEVVPATPLAAGDKDYSELSVSWRLAISAAGPAANFLLAALIYWLLFVVGVPANAPLLGDVDPDTPLGKAGLSRYSEIISVDGRRTQNWQQVNLALAERMGESGSIALEARLPGSAVEAFSVPIDNWHQGAKDPDLLGSLGFTGAAPALVGEVLPGGAGERDGLEQWDLITAVDGEGVETWGDWVRVIQSSPEQSLSVTVLRGGRTVTLDVVPDRRLAEDGAEIGYLNVAAHYYEESYGPFAALPRAVAETWDKTVFTLGVLKKMVTGSVSLENLSGPIMIAKVAGDSASAGWQYFLTLGALLSISLGVLNLLPIPILDGGHIMFGLAELVRGKPLPEKVQIVATQVGIVLVGGMMIFAIYNDLTRFI